MAQLGKKFDATAIDTTQTEYAELPNGIYVMEIDSSDVTPTKAGDGIILKTTNVVVEPEEYKGRKLFSNYNLENKSAQAQEIGQRQFAALCRAIGVGEVEDSEELHFRTFTVKVSLGKPSKDGSYPARAEIKRYYFPDEGNVPEPGVDDAQPAQPPRTANDNKAAAKPASSAAAAAAGKKRPWG
jgi:hypothetical protein